MRAVVLRSLLVVGLGAAVLVAVLYVASTVDARAPEVLGISVTQPVAGDPERALITTSIEVEFSEPVAASAADAVSVEPGVEGSVSWSGSTLIFTPSEPLELETEYTVAVADGVLDAAGNRIDELPPAFAFETAGRPTIVETTPADGSADVPVDGPIGIEFSTLMDTAAVEAGLSIQPAFAHEIRWSGEVLEIVPLDALEPDRQYTISIRAEAADVAGVALGEDHEIGFRTVAPGLRMEALVPAADVDGVAPATAIAVVFDRPVDPDSVEAADLVISPAVAGTLDVAPFPGDPGAENADTRMVRFTPSGPLPPNTTFDVALAAGIESASGGELAEPIEWSFTTGSPPSTVSNQIAFLSDRAGVVNVWVMNPDGTGQRQLSAELSPIVDYAVAPDGSSLVVADGRRLVFLRADGSERRVLTDGSHLEFDPAFAPDGQRVAFGRADAESGSGLGLWEWELGSGEPEPVEPPDDVRATPEPSGSASQPKPWLRAPRYAPDGQALAFVDAAGAVGILELPAQRLTMVPFVATGAPAWLPDSSAILVSGGATPATPATPAADAPVEPMTPGADDTVHRIGRSATRPADAGMPPGWQVLRVAADGTLAYVDGAGSLGTAADLADVGDPSLVDDARVIGADFAPGEAAMVVVVTPDDSLSGAVERLDLSTGSRTELAPDGSRPRWLP